MERTTWTDERLDDLAEATRTGFARVDQDIRELRAEMHAGFAQMQSTMNRFGAGIMVALLGVIAAIFVQGA
jgi:hypothetical protein